MSWYFLKLQSLGCSFIKAAALSKKRLQHCYFPVSLEKFLEHLLGRTPSWKSSGRLLLWLSPETLSFSFFVQTFWCLFVYLANILSCLSSDYDHTNTFDSYKVCSYVCYWISPLLVSFCESMSWWCKRKKKRENSL